MHWAGRNRRPDHVQSEMVNMGPWRARFPQRKLRSKAVLGWAVEEQSLYPCVFKIRSPSFDSDNAFQLLSMEREALSWPDSWPYGL
jgi:hypothetical protein